MHVRFDCSLADARAFAKAMTGGTPLPGNARWQSEPSLQWWPAELPPGTESTEETSAPTFNGLPPIRVFIQPRGQVATVWVETFTT